MAVEVGTAVAGVAGRLLPKALDYLQKNRRLRAGLKDDIKHIQSEFLFISAAIEGDGDCPRWSGNNLRVHEQWIVKVRELAHEIEDCIDRYIHSTMIKTEASWIRRKVHRVKTRRTSNKFAAGILRLRKESDEIRRLKESYTTNNGGGPSSSSTLEPEAPKAEELGYTPNPVGMEEPHDEILELIKETSAQGEPDALKVISIVGFGGIGKTQLARYVYNTIESQYNTRAWAHAAEKGSMDVLEDILKQLGSAGRSRHRLQECLGNKRYIIVSSFFHSSLPQKKAIRCIFCFIAILFD